MSNKLSWILLDVFVNFIYQSINRKHFSCLYYRKESWQNQFFRSVSVFWLLGCYGPSSILMGGNFFRYPKLYDLSKIHKGGAPLRPIMSSIYHTEISWIWSKLHVTVHREHSYVIRQELGILYQHHQKTNTTSRIYISQLWYGVLIQPTKQLKLYRRNIN